MIAFFTYIGAGEDETKLANKVLPRYKKQLTPEYDSGSGTGPCDITQMIESLGANLKGSYVKVATRHCDGVKGWNPNTADVETWKPLTLMRLNISNALGQPET